MRRQMEGAHLALLGGFCLRDPAGREIAIGSRKAQALLAVLGVAFPGSVSRERLIGILWGEHSQERARHSLRQTISELRRDVPLLIVVRGDALALERSCLHGGCRRVPGVRGGSGCRIARPRVVAVWRRAGRWPRRPRRELRGLAAHRKSATGRVGVGHDGPSGEPVCRVRRSPVRRGGAAALAGAGPGLRGCPPQVDRITGRARPPQRGRAAVPRLRRRVEAPPRRRAIGADRGPARIDPKAACRCAAACAGRQPFRQAPGPGRAALRCVAGACRSGADGAFDVGRSHGAAGACVGVGSRGLAVGAGGRRGVVRPARGGAGARRALSRHRAPAARARGQAAAECRAGGVRGRAPPVERAG